MISLWKSRIKPADLCPGCSQGTARPMTAASSCWLKWMSGKAEATRQSFNLSTTSPRINKSRWTIPPGYNSSVNIYLALLSQPGCIIENREGFFFFFKRDAVTQGMFFALDGCILTALFQHAPGICESVCRSTCPTMHPLLAWFK